MVRKGPPPKPFDPARAGEFSGISRSPPLAAVAAGRCVRCGEPQDGVANLSYAYEPKDVYGGRTMYSAGYDPGMPPEGGLLVRPGPFRTGRFGDQPEMDFWGQLTAGAVFDLHVDVVRVYVAACSSCGESDVFGLRAAGEGLARFRVVSPVRDGAGEEP